MIYTVWTALKNFEFWGGGKDNAMILSDEEFDTIEEIIENNLFEKIPTETEINDFFWFDFEFISNLLWGISEEEAHERFKERCKDEQKK